MEETGSAADFLPSRITLPALRDAVQGCRGCPLYENATQAVFGEGARSAAVMLVGEQPGDQEDLAGRPFVGPAGKLLDRALEEAGIDRKSAYVTNAVKHFKWEARGKRRIHAKPSWSEVAACRPWLEAELAVVKPTVLVLLGAVAAQGLLGRQFRVTKQRGELVDSPLAPHVTATIHPSAILRGEPADRERELSRLVDDLKKVAALL
jgi:DNA polymerase